MNSKTASCRSSVAENPGEKTASGLHAAHPVSPARIPLTDPAQDPLSMRVTDRHQNINRFLDETRGRFILTERYVYAPQVRIP